MHRMKNNFLSLVALFVVIQCSSQKKEVITLFFNLDENEVVTINGDIKKTKKFFKNEEAFYINRQYFKIKKK